MQKLYLKDNQVISHSFPFSLNGEYLDSLLNFYSSKEQICLLEGQAGSFKTKLLNYSLNYLKDDVLLFKFKCFEGSTLDDIFLSFFEDLKKYSQQKKISFTKIETNSLSKRINTYLHHISLPCLIVIDSLENIFNKNNKSEQNEILAYIKHLNSMNKFKIVLVSSFYDTDFQSEFENKVNIRIQAFDKEQIKKYFEHYSILFEPEDLENFFNITRGNTLYSQLTANLITTLKINISSLLREFSNKKISFGDFLLQKIVTFIPETVKKYLYTLSLLNEGMTESYLISQNFFTKDQILYLTDKSILCEEYGYLFLKSYLKKYLQSSIAHFERIKIHKYWKDFYSSQLPVPPNNRVILISRNTMRSQADYHSSFIIEKSHNEKKQANMSLMSYLNSNITAWNIKNTNIDETEEIDEAKQPSEHKKRPVPPKSLQNRDKRFEKYALTKDEISLLSLPVDLQKKEEADSKEKLYRTFEQKEEALISGKSEKSLKDIFDKACELENAHDFETAYTVYCSLLSLKTNEAFYDYEPLIIEKLAFCSHKMNRTTDAIDFYNKLTEIYSARNNLEKVNEVRLKIAAIYKETYKINHARVIFENFVNKKTQASDNIIFHSYVELAEIEEDLSNTEKAIEYYKKAFALLDTSLNLEENYLAQAYFKYALILDDYNQTQAALDFYQKSVQTASENCIYKSAAYTNIAEIIKETGNLKMASDYYKMALKTDIAQSNYEGVYYICLKLAHLYESLGPKHVLNWLLKSLSAAKRTKENLYITNAYIETGDYYNNNANYEKGFKAYLLAHKSIMQMEPSQEEHKSLEMRIDDIKKKLTKEQISKIEKEVNQDD